MRKALLVAAALVATPALAQANPQIDYPAFQTLTASVAPQRATRLLKFDAFKAEAAKPGTLLLDARSKDAFAAGHIAGAVNLPLTDFTAVSLAAVIGANVRGIRFDTLGTGAAAGLAGAFAAMTLLALAKAALARL